MQNQSIFSEIERQTNQMIEALKELIHIPAIAPESGGEGELKKAERLVQLLTAMKFDKIEHFDAEDERVPSKKRPNIVAYYNGKDKQERLWIITHLDIVPPGEESSWTITKPYEPVVKDERIYGRGSEDNMQSLIASIFAIKALQDLGIRPKRTVALAFVADEEQGSKYGIQHLIKQGLFRKTDLIVVPDSGREDGSFIEIAEKSAIWFRIRTTGKQAHASMPAKGLNAHRIGMKFALALDEMLHRKYSKRNEYFDPPESTIEPTKKDKNVEAINIIPGEDFVYFDCRILPDYNISEVEAGIRELAKEFAKKTNAKIDFELLHESVAPKPTNPDARIVQMIKDAIKEVRAVSPKVGGIGGGTCGAYFREVGIPAVVWSTIDEVAHQPNEYAKIKNLVSDAKVYALLAVS